MLGPHTLLCGHDIGSVERWPEVRLAVDQFVQDYSIRANVWIAHASGIAHLQALPEAAAMADLVAEVHRLQQPRYHDPVSCARFQLPSPLACGGGEPSDVQEGAQEAAHPRLRRGIRP